MKQKRTFVTLLLIVGLLCLGIAYASFTGDVLTINGTATADVASGNVNVVFTAAAAAEGSNAGTKAEITNEEEDTASFTVAGLTTAGQTQTVTFDVENRTENGVPVTLSAPEVVCGNTEWYEVITCEYDKTSLGAYDTENNTNDTAKLTVTVKLLKTVSTDDSKTEANTNNTVTITLNAEAASN